MPDLLCPFTATLVQNDFACPHAYEIVRRGGAETACQHQDTHSLCSVLHEKIKAAALDAMELEDDLLTLPHSVLVRIQFGGLLGLQQAVEYPAEDPDRVDNIAALIERVKETFADLDDVPYEQTSQAIINYKRSRRSRKK